MIVLTPPLDVSDTVPVGMLRHRLALGVALVDAVRGGAALGPLRVELESIGPYRPPADRPAGLPARLEPHGADRHAARYAGAIAKLVDRCVANALDTSWVLRIYAPLDAAARAFDPARDARHYVPRRMRLTPVFDAGVPAATPLNIRQITLWPGAAAPLPSTATCVRGRVLRGPDIASGEPVPYARLAASVPASETNFAAATVVGRGAADERGEFVLVIEARAMSGAGLVNPVPLRLWAFAPPAQAPDPNDALASVPVEDAGTATDSDILRGLTVPAGYTEQVSKTLACNLGETLSGTAATLLLP